MVQLAHLDPWHSEGHWLYGALGEHESHSYLDIVHVALRLGQKGQALRTGNNQEVSTSQRWHRFEGDMRADVWYLMWFRRAETAALKKVRSISDNLINEHSGIALQNK